MLALKTSISGREFRCDRCDEPGAVGVKLSVRDGFSASDAGHAGRNLVACADLHGREIDR
jgi:hypothetical protein